MTRLQANSTPLLSIALIVKNEEHTLPTLFKSLESLKDIPLQIVVVDTGSSDNTVKICEEFGCEIQFFKWINDYSQARNYGLKRCHGNWILWLDADDLLPPETSYWLTTTLPTLDPSKVYLFNIDSPHQGASSSVFHQIRLFPNHHNLQFHNPIHESLSQSIRENNLVGKALPLSITHMGYYDPKQVEFKNQQKKELLEDLFQKNKLPLALIFSLARTYQTENKHHQALNLYQEILQNPQAKNIQQDVFIATHIYYGQCLGFLNKIPEALEWFKKHQSIAPQHPQYLFEWGKLHYIQNQHAEALKLFEQTLSLPAIKWGIPTDWKAIQLGSKHLIQKIKATLDSQSTTSPTKSSVAGTGDIPLDLNQSFGRIKTPLQLPYSKNTLTVIMIVKNEAPNIQHAVESFYPFADEIIINDTGSTDGTQKILENLNVTWFQTQWENDFSLARNQSLAKATSSWVLWLDADDRIPKDQVITFNKLKTATLDRIFGFQVINTQAGQAVGTRFMQLRMFPNHPDITFERRIHEQFIFSAAKLGVHCLYTETTIHHTGYESETTKKEKARRNLKLAEAESELLGVDPTFTMSLGDSYFILEEWEKGISYYQQTLSIPHLQSINKDVYNILPCYIGLGEQKLGRYTQSITWLDQARELDPQKLDPVYYKAISLQHLNRQAEASELFKQVIKMPLVHSSTGNQFDILKIYSYHYLSQYLVEQKEYKEAIYLLEEMHQHYSLVIESWATLGLCWLKLNDTPQAIKAWKHSCRLNPSKSKGVLLQLIPLIKTRGKPEDADEFIQLFTEHFSQESQKISLCMIVKNEEKNLVQCLDSVKDFFDEIIVVDTGSQDNTLSIAKKYGAKTIEFPWVNDFSQARNISLEHATCPWIFWLDADDLLLESDKQAIKQLLDKKNDIPKAYSFLVQNSADKGNTGSVFNQIRLFPNQTAIRFTSPVHEQVLPSLEKLNIPIEYTSIKVIHTGYENPETARLKQVRNKEYLLHQVQQKKNLTPVTYYSLGHACMDLKEYADSIEWFLLAAEQAEKTNTSLHILHICPAKIATALAFLQQYDQALGALSVDLSQTEPQAETILLKAQIEEKLHHDDEAFRWYTQLLKLKEATTFIPIDYPLLKIKALKFLGEYWFKKGKRELAKDLLNDGIQIKSGQTFSIDQLKKRYQQHHILAESYLC